MPLQCCFLKATQALYALLERSFCEFHARERSKRAFPAQAGHVAHEYALCDGWSHSQSHWTKPYDNALIHYDAIIGRLLRFL
jgi:hypothetical protein